MVGVVNLPEQIIEKIRKNILPQWKICFLSAVIVGFIAHLYKITNWLPNWDSLVFRYDAQNMINMGRWFLPVVCAPSSYYDLPWLTGLVAIIFHALGAVCICKMFGIQKKITAVLIGAIVVTFPTVTSVMMYNYVADGYSLSFLLACIAAMNLTKEKPGYAASVIIIALSVGIYQAYITVTIMLLLCYLITELIHKATDVRCIIFKSIKFMLTGVVGMALYYLILTVLLKITGTTPLEYQGFNSAASLSDINIWNSLYVIKHSFTDYFFDFSKGLNVFNVLNCIVFLATVILYLINIMKNKLSISKLVLLGVYVLLLPIGTSILAFVNSSIDYHNLMKMGFCVFYLFFILTYDKTEFKNTKIYAVKSWTILVLAFVLIINQVVVANISYHKLQIAYEKSYGTLIRIADRIEQTDEALDCDKILVVGALPGSEAYSVNLPPDMTGTTDSFILRADDEIVHQSVMCSALNDYCGKDYKFVSGEEKIKFLKKNKIDNLSFWPEKNSISVIDDVIVIKLGAESE